MLILVFSIFFVPNLIIEDSLYYSILDKHAFLEKEHSPRLIFLGGSNLSFGLDSKTIEDSLGVSVINMGIQAGIGLKYICSDVLPFIQKGDIIVVSPEFAHLIKNDENTFLGTDKLLYILFDVYPEGRKSILSISHWLHLIKQMPKYAADKIYYFPKGLLNKYFDLYDSDPSGIYSRNSFNENGDVTAHWSMKNEKVDPYKYTGEVNSNAIEFLNNYKKDVESKGAKVYYMSTCYPESAYEMNKDIILSIDNALKQDFKIPEIGNVERYIFKDSLFFNTVYHLNKQGVDLRTKYVIEDIKSLNKYSDQINNRALDFTISKSSL